ncbi:hypothetical protein TNCV_1367511 [Trichonephila clavipes]|nr:hypothetical protein TNCV_1367511 [Trichonephila clavipes]
MFDPSSFANPTPLAHADTSSYYALTKSSRSHGFMPRSAPPSTNEAPVYPTAIGAGGNRRGRLFASPDLPGPVWR